MSGDVAAGVGAENRFVAVYGHSEFVYVFRNMAWSSR
jgi:hypothetical protein